jgi:hypothetical protein
MTNEQFTEELLHKSHSLGITDQVWKLAHKLQEEDRTLDMHGSIHQAYEQLTK